MSSGISIDEGRLKPAAAVEAGFSRPDSRPDDGGFHAWHFFVLASILLATVSVFLARRSSPEQLILLSLTIAAAGAVGGAFYRTLLPLLSANPAVLDEPLTERRRAALERDKLLTLRAIKELEFDRAMGKLSPKDFDELGARLRQRAVSLMRELDQGAGYRALIERDLQERLRGRLTAEGVRLEPDATESSDMRSVRLQADLCQCGTANDIDAVFCKKCGTRLQAA